MKYIKHMLIAGTLLFLSPTNISAYQTDIEDKDEVIIQNITRHFNGVSNLERDEDGTYYAEYIFDGVNVTIRGHESFVWINGEPRPYKTMNSDGVLLPKHHVVSKIWDETRIPVDLFLREFGYKIVDNKLVFDKPLGIINEVKNTEENNGARGEKNTNHTETNESDDEQVLEIPDEEDIKDTDSEKNDINIRPTDVEDTDSSIEQPTSKPESDEAEVNKDKEDTNNTEDKEEKEDTTENELEVNTFSLIGETYRLGKHFSLKSSYPERQKYITDGNILTSWHNLSVKSSKSTLIVGLGNTTFKKIQGKLKIGDKVSVVDNTMKSKEYAIKEKRQSEPMSTDSLHDELYEEYWDINSVIIQFQEEDMMSFYIAV